MTHPLWKPRSPTGTNGTSVGGTEDAQQGVGPGQRLEHRVLFPVSSPPDCWSLSMRNWQITASSSLASETRSFTACSAPCSVIVPRESDPKGVRQPIPEFVKSFTSSGSRTPRVVRQSARSGRARRPKTEGFELRRGPSDLILVLGCQQLPKASQDPERFCLH
jgi:hypothetical protein